jgi:sensor histidine kinase YesM
MSKTPFPYSALPFPIKFIDKRFPGMLGFQLKILLFAVVTQLFFSLIKKSPLLSEKSLYGFILMVVILEVFMWLAYKIFVNRTTLGETRQEISKNIIIRYFFFYIACFIAAFIEFILFLYIIYWINGGDLSKVFYNFIHFEFKGWFKGVNNGLLFGTFLFVIGIWQEALKRAEKFKEEKLMFQYETLKNQINPHFLFNSLNTLSSLVGTNAELAEHFIQKLSMIYRYVLEYREAELIDLQSELTFVNDYFYLQQIRDEDKISLNIDIVEIENYKILPMSLQLLVENALKHNSCTRESPLKILIRQHNDTLEVTNNLQKKLSMDHTAGIGLKNLGERTKFIAKTELQVIETSSEFKVIVPLIPTSK